MNRLPVARSMTSVENGKRETNAVKEPLPKGKRGRDRNKFDIFMRMILKQEGDPLDLTKPDSGWKEPARP